jgi:hypothetical protein
VQKVRKDIEKKEDKRSGTSRSEHQVSKNNKNSMPTTTSLLPRIKLKANPKSD